MNEAFDRPCCPEFSGEETVLWTDGNLGEVGVPPRYAMRQHQDSIRTETFADGIQGYASPLIRASGHTTAIPHGIRSEADKIDPISDQQSEKEGTGKKTCEEHGCSYHTEKSDESRRAGWVCADGERAGLHKNSRSGMRKAC